MRLPSTDLPVSSIEYEELEIEVSRCLCGKQEVRILDSVFNRPRERFEPSYDAAELNRRLEKLDELVLRTGDTAGERRTLAESIGKDLYAALLPGSVRQTFSMSLAALRGVRAYRNVGLRLRLSFGEASRYLPEIVGLPWELLCSPETLEFPASAPETPLVRFLDLERPIQQIEISPPIRILAVLAAPESMREIDRERHRSILREACPHGGLLDEPLFLQPPTLGALREVLSRERASEKPIHVVHFLGHGAFDDNGEGYLNFETAGRGRDRVPGRHLARVLTGFPEVRVVVLATCVGARMMRLAGQHPFAGSASALVAAGLAAVVGMQLPVSEDAAAEFTRAFYGELAEGRSLEEAVTEGRMRMFIAENSSFEWASPVLFLRSRTGNVLDLKPSKNRREDPIAHPDGSALPSAHSDRNTAPSGVSRDYYQAQRDLKVVRGDNFEADRDVNIGRQPRKW